MTGPLYAHGRWCARHRLVVVLVWVVVAVVLTVAARSMGLQTSDNLNLPGTGSKYATDLLSARFPSEAYGAVPIAIKAPAGVELTDRRYEAAIGQVASAYAKDPAVTRVVSPFSAVGKAQLSRDGTIGYISLNLRNSSSKLTTTDANAIIAIANPAKAAGLQVAAGGYLGQEVSKPSTGTSAVVGLSAAIVILLLTLGTAVAMGLPLLTALLGLGSGLAVITLLSRVVEVPSVAPALGTMLGLGVGIDYGLFVVTRHLEQLRAGMEVRESIARSVATSGGAVVFAGVSVIIALLSLALASIPLVTTLGYTAAIVVAIAVSAALTLLPALLSLVGLRIHALAVPRRRPRHGEGPTGWQYWARLVVGHPTRSILAGLVILAVVATPIRMLHLGEENNGALPTHTQSRQSYDIMSAGFGSGSNGPILIAAAPSSGTTSTSDPRLARLRGGIESTPGVKVITPPLVNQAGTAAVFTVISDYAPSDRKTEDLVRTLRDDTIPTVTRGQHMRVDVGGTTAGYIDLSNQISSKLPMVIAIVLSLSFVLLALAFRSVLVPVKAVIANLLSVGAAFGVLTYVFGHHWSAAAIGLHGSVPIAGFVPLLMFAILFGLSMDYEVFLMTRIREQWSATGHAQQAVTDGLARSARVITSAAMIMVCVFLAFLLSGDPNVMQFGLGLAAAVAVDVTLVRCLIVPAAMSLLGRAAWWLPRWLAPRVPDLSIDGEQWFEQHDKKPAIGTS